MNKVAKVITLLVALAIALTIGGVTYAEAPDSPPTERATLTFNGESHILRVGEVAYVPDNPPTTLGVCDAPAMTINVLGSSGITSVVLSTDEHCITVVEEITMSKDDVIFYDPSEIHYRGWAKSELSDKPGFDLASVRATFEYFYDGKSVYGGRNDFAFCDTGSYIGGWSVESCTWAMSGIGPNHVNVRGRGEFSHEVLGPIADHWQKSVFNATPGDYDYSCYHTDMNLFYTKWGCSGGRDKLD